MLYEKGKECSRQTAIHVLRLFVKFCYDEVFGRSAVIDVFDLKKSRASKLLSHVVQADIIEPVSGCGKGKYRFKTQKTTRKIP